MASTICHAGPGDDKAEIRGRNPNSEGRTPKETRIPKTEGIGMHELPRSGNSTALCRRPGNRLSLIVVRGGISVARLAAQFAEPVTFRASNRHAFKCQLLRCDPDFTILPLTDPFTI
jgi:hypothetical protein